MSDKLLFRAKVRRLQPGSWFFEIKRGGLPVWNGFGTAFLGTLFEALRVRNQLEEDWEHGR